MNGFDYVTNAQGARVYYYVSIDSGCFDLLPDSCHRVYHAFAELKESPESEILVRVPFDFIPMQDKVEFNLAGIEAVDCECTMKYARALFMQAKTAITKRVFLETLDFITYAPEWDYYMKEGGLAKVGKWGCAVKNVELIKRLLENAVRNKQEKFGIICEADQSVAVFLVTNPEKKDYILVRHVSVRDCIENGF